jgi:hypothetical protein
MILETVVCQVLHCSRCNTPFRDDVDDDYSGTTHWDNGEDIAEQFAKGLGEYGGWRCFGDRYVCSGCQISNGYGDDPDAREVPEPLPPADADKVTRQQLAYAQAQQHIVALDADSWTIKHPLSCRPNLFDCPVNKAAERDLTEPPVVVGRFVCDLDENGRFAIRQPTREASDA